MRVLSLLQGHYPDSTTEINFIFNLDLKMKNLGGLN